MTSAALLRALATIGWTQSELARRTGTGRSTVQQWTDGKVLIPDDVAVWLVIVAQWITRNPGPRTKKPAAG